MIYFFGWLGGSSVGDVSIVLKKFRLEFFVFTWEKIC